jgi:hypothetical protein
MLRDLEDALDSLDPAKLAKEFAVLCLFVVVP